MADTKPSTADPPSENPPASSESFEVKRVEIKGSWGDVADEIDNPTASDPKSELPIDELSIQDRKDLDEPDDSNIQAVTTGDTPYTSAKKFEDLNLSEELLKELYVEMRFERPSKIQAITLPMILTPPYRNLIAQAHNGSGKTTCFVRGMLSRVHQQQVLQDLCICPTRELAIQELKRFPSLRNDIATFSFEEIKLSTQNFSKKYVIGDGSYGTVYRATVNGGHLVAVKRAKQGQSAQLENEIEILSRLKHKNIVALLGICYEEGRPLLIYEYFPKGSLYKALSSRVHLSWNVRLLVALGVARGLEYIHDNVYPPIIHMDIKMDNILLDANLNAKLTDFGVSVLLSNAGSKDITFRGTSGYVDPKYRKTLLLTPECDVYSFGVVMLELVTGISASKLGEDVCIATIKKAEEDIHSVVDPTIRSDALPGLKEFAKLAMKCVRALGDEQPSMLELVCGIQNIIKAGNVVIDVGEAVDDVGSTSVPCKDEDSGSPKPCYDKYAPDEPIGSSFCDMVVNRVSGWER